MSNEEIKSYAKHFEDCDSSSDSENGDNEHSDHNDLVGGSLMGGALTGGARKKLLQMLMGRGIPKSAKKFYGAGMTGGRKKRGSRKMRGGALTGGGPSAWIEFSKAYRAEHPGAKMPAIRSAYYAAMGKPVPAKKARGAKKELSLDYLLKHGVAPTIKREKKEYAYLTDVINALDDKYKNPSLYDKGTKTLKQEEDFMEDLEDYSKFSRLVKRKPLTKEQKAKRLLALAKARATKAAKAAKNRPILTRADLEDMAEYGRTLLDEDEMPVIKLPSVIPRSGIKKKMT
jgi:hypothetical protein